MSEHLSASRVIAKCLTCGTMSKASPEWECVHPDTVTFDCEKCERVTEHSLVIVNPPEQRVEIDDPEKFGFRVARFLHLKQRKDGRYHTEWGTKTAHGLGLCLIRLYETANDQDQ